jgi:hypothetical protein
VNWAVALAPAATHNAQVLETNIADIMEAIGSMQDLENKTRSALIKA